MKIKFVLILFLLVGLKTQTFFDKIVEDNTVNPFLVLVAKQNDEVFEILMRKSSLRKYINDVEDSITPQTLSNHFYAFLNRKDTIIIDSIDYGRISYAEICSDSLVEKVSLKGKEYFIDYFFDRGAVLKASISRNSIPLIIKKLYLWEIAVGTDCESGWYIIMSLKKVDHLQNILDSFNQE